jgi:hypothetical protein
VYKNPFKGIRKHVENERGTSKTKRKHTIEKIQITPFHAKKFPVVRMYWCVTKGGFNIGFGHETFWT